MTVICIGALPMRLTVFVGGFYTLRVQVPKVWRTLFASWTWMAFFRCTLFLCIAMAFYIYLIGQQLIFCSINTNGILLSPRSRPPVNIKMVVNIKKAQPVDYKKNTSSQIHEVFDFWI
jgi:hypothetical protein